MRSGAWQGNAWWVSPSLIMSTHSLLERWSNAECWSRRTEEGKGHKKPGSLCSQETCPGESSGCKSWAAGTPCSDMGCSGQVNCSPTQSAASLLKLCMSSLFACCPHLILFYFLLLLTFTFLFKFSFFFFLFEWGNGYYCPDSSISHFISNFEAFSPKDTCCFNQQQSPVKTRLIKEITSYIFLMIWNKQEENSTVSHL